MTMDREEELIAILGDNVKELMNGHSYEEEHIIGIVENALAKADQEPVPPQLKCGKCYSRNVRNYLGFYNKETLQIKICMDCNSTDIERYDY